MEYLEEDTTELVLQKNFNQNKINELLQGFDGKFINDNFRIANLELLLTSTMKKNVQVNRSVYANNISDENFNLFNRLGYSDDDIVEATKQRPKSKALNLYSFDSVYWSLVTISPSLIIKQITDSELTSSVELIR